MDDEIGVTCSIHGRENKYKVLIRKPDGKIPPGRPRHRCKDINGVLVDYGCYEG
jgi:hypothetical protein